jgi:ribosome biogenesis GTPase
VVAVNRHNYVVHNGRGEFFAEITGRIMGNASSSLDYPTVGDFVDVQTYNDDTFAVIHAILPRQTELKRKVAGKRVEYQMLGANIDTAFIMQSLDADFSIERLERYLITIRDAGIQPVLLLSKTDLQDEAVIAGAIADIHLEYPDLPVIAMSNTSGSGINAVEALLKAAHTYCLLGSSGVGKSTLINRLAGENILRTGSIREKDQKGRHTTTRREMLFLPNGAMIIDTPGMREIGSIGVEAGIEDTFSVISSLSNNCKFRNCSHKVEKGCAVLAAVASGEISDSQYQSYLQLQKESEYNQKSYLEKRKQDKAFGKMVKSVIKHKKKNR